MAGFERNGLLTAATHLASRSFSSSPEKKASLPGRHDRIVPMSLKIDGLLFVLFFAATLQAQVQLKVLTFNVQHGYGTDNVHSVTRQVQYVIAQKPDVVVMNEVSKPDISGYLQQLKAQSGVVWNSVYFDDQPGKNEGNMIVTRMSVTTSATHQYPTTFAAGINMTMSAVEATIGGYCVFGTHLAWKGTVGAHARTVQVNDLVPWLATF
jgi:endonuclease/exonuclease/phosphatase family metal-dependent hydrolase